MLLTLDTPLLSLGLDMPASTFYVLAGLICLYVLIRAIWRR